MKISKIVLSSLLLASVSLGVKADDGVIGKIQMIQPYLPQGLVYFTLQGAPTLNGGSCPHSYFVGKMDDGNFKSFLYPVLLSAKATNADIKFIVNGCNGAYPLVVGAEYSPRE